jgi:hypothetical protein
LPAGQSQEGICRQSVRFVGQQDWGNANLKWAFSEAAVGFLRNNPKGQAYLARLEKKHGKAKALTALAHKLGRAVYYILQRQKAFDMKRFMNG